MKVFYEVELPLLRDRGYAPGASLAANTRVVADSCNGLIEPNSASQINASGYTDAPRSSGQ